MNNCHLAVQVLCGVDRSNRSVNCMHGLHVLQQLAYRVCFTASRAFTTDRPTA